MIDKGLNVNQRCKHTSLHYVIIIETINNNMLGFKLRSIGNNPYMDITDLTDLTENYRLEELNSNEY